MILLNLALAVLLAGSTPGPDPSALVGRLGSPRFAEREQAADVLRDLGPDALPALRAGRQARDPEVRARAAALLDRIESALMVRPTLVALDFRDRPLADVARALGERARMALVPEDPEDQDLWQDHRVTLEAPGPVPFWTAVDRLCAAGSLRYGPGPRPGGTGELEAGLLLSSRPEPREHDRDRDRAPTSDSGPFRVKLARLHYERNRAFEEDEDEAADEDFRAHLQVWAEPRLLIGQSGPLDLIEATDDQGRSLLPPAVPTGPVPIGGAMPGVELEAAYDDQPFGQGAVQVQAGLRFPDRPQARVIRRLRGAIPLAVAARKSDPLAVPLAGASGKSFGEGDLRLTLHDFKAEPNGMGAALELTIRPGSDPAAAAATPPALGDLAPAAGLQTLEHQLEILDVMGRVLPWSLTSQDVRGDGFHLTIAVAPSEDSGAPDRLRLYGLTRSTARVTFEFNDVRMP